MKRSKLNDGRVAQHPVKTSKGENKKAERTAENRQLELNKKIRLANSYSKRETQKNEVSEKQSSKEVP